MTEDRDFEYVRDFISGNESSFNILVHKYQQKIYWHARRMLGNHMDADEVTQEVLIVLFNKLKDFKFGSSLYTWIFRITATRCINFLNKKKIKKILFWEDAEVQEINSGNNIINDLENREKIKKLDSILQKIPVKQREVFILRNFEEMSYEEISAITGKSIGGLKANYFHALKKITEMMDEKE